MTQEPEFQNISKGVPDLTPPDESRAWEGIVNQAKPLYGIAILAAGLVLAVLINNYFVWWIVVLWLVLLPVVAINVTLGGSAFESTPRMLSRIKVSYDAYKQRGGANRS